MVSWWAQVKIMTTSFIIILLGKKSFQQVIIDLRRLQISFFKSLISSYPFVPHPHPHASNFVQRVFAGFGGSLQNQPNRPRASEIKGVTRKQGLAGRAVVERR
jgi:hypothetical protein